MEIRNDEVSQAVELANKTLPTSERDLEIYFLQITYILGLNATLGRRRIRKRRRKVKENMVRGLEIETFTRHVVETGNNILEKGL